MERKELEEKQLEALAVFYKKTDISEKKTATHFIGLVCTFTTVWFFPIAVAGLYLRAVLNVKGEVRV